MQVSVLNGVNLNMLGRRDPDQYGTVTLAQLETMIYGWARDLRVDRALLADEQRGRVRLDGSTRRSTAPTA